MRGYIYIRAHEEFMAQLYLNLNGSVIRPTDIKVEDQRITANGSPLRMAAGNLRIWHITFKKRWTLTWENLPEAQLAGLQALFRTTTPITFIDENNVSFTVITTSYSTEFGAATVSLQKKIYYNVSLTIEEV